MDPSYWIIEDAIIFKPEFNSCLDDYTSIISNYRILIFSNYNDPYQTLKNNNMFNIKNYKLFTDSSFNQLLGDSLLNLTNLKELIFGAHFCFPLNNSLTNLVDLQKLTFSGYFNCPLKDSLSKLHNLKELTFGWKFNNPLDNCLSNLVNLQKLTFGNYFNWSLNDSLTNLVDLEELTFGFHFNHSLNDSLSKLTNLKKLSLGYRFNQPIDIPHGIKKLFLDCNSHLIIDYLPSNVVELEFGGSFNLELNDLPNSIKKIKILNSGYDKKLNNLPTRIETLEISKYYEIPIDTKYKNLNIIYFD